MTRSKDTLPTIFLIGIICVGLGFILGMALIDRKYRNDREQLKEEIRNEMYISPLNRDALPSGKESGHTLGGKG